MIPHDLVARLEARRLEAARAVTDRGITYRQHYDIGGGNAWSKSFSEASNRALGWSLGAHGLRHGYAQERLWKLQPEPADSGAGFQGNFDFQARREPVALEVMAVPSPPVIGWLHMVGEYYLLQIIDIRSLFVYVHL